MSRDYVLQPFQPAVNLQIDYVAELNEQQHAAVTAPPGPALVIAGAGSGKTRTLTYRVAFLLEQGIPPDRILLLTFTNKAAKEMMLRVTDLLGQKMEALWGGTFHSIGNRVLRRYADLVGYQPDFTIMDREDARHLLTTCISEAGIDRKKLDFPKAEVLAEIISMALNTRKPLRQFLQHDYAYFGEVAPQIEEVEKRYITRKRDANAMDFDDLLVLWLKLIEEHSDIRENFQRRFQFILVDEYQDTNRLQSDLIDLLAARHHNVMVVGDDAQSIYAWRGANYQNILKFPERYPETKIYKIETNYRSTPEILTVANAAIAANTQQFTKQLTPARKSGNRPALVVCEDGTQQARFIAQRVLELHEEGVALHKMAVLYRSHFHALELQLELTRQRVPFTITSGVRFFEQAHVKDVTSYLKLATNPRDELSFKRIAQLLPGIGSKGADKLWKTFDNSGSNGFPMAYSPFPSPSHDGKGVAASDSVATETPIAFRLQSCASAVPKKAAIAWAQLVATMAQLEQEKPNASKMILLVIEAGYDEHLKENYTNYLSRSEDLQQLAVFANQFAAIEDFLSELALLTNVDAEEERPAERDEELRLSTIHQAKGLEFDIVFVIMLCEGLFPSARSMETPDGEEEERRLMYVAITRARNELYLSYPLIRSAPRGSAERQLPSRFLGEIPTDLIEEWNLRPYG
jgi:DNA helicase-2/ATP-dependent DNA helicase PcrA